MDDLSNTFQPKSCSQYIPEKDNQARVHNPNILYFLKTTKSKKMDFATNSCKMAAYCDVYQGIFLFSLLKYMYTSEYRNYSSSPKNCMYVHTCTHMEGKIIVFCFLSFYNAAVALKQCRNLNLVPQV